MIRITQIKISIDEPVSKVKSLVLKKLRLQESDLLDYRIYKESIDNSSKTLRPRKSRTRLVNLPSEKVPAPPSPN